MLIAEIGWNFLGDIDLAFKMIKSAKKSGANFVKFQIWDPKYLKNGPWDYDGRKEIYFNSQITINKYKKIHSFANDNKIKCFVSVPTIRDLKKVLKVQNDYIKIPSMESYNHKLINFALNNFNKVFLSCGALKKNELMSLLKFNSINNLYLAHCVSSYPMNLKDFNLGKFNFIKNNFKNYGYSGHYDGVEDAYFAISNGAKFIEKHFTIDKHLPGRDNKFAILPHDFLKIKNYMTSVKQMTRLNNLNLPMCEKEVYKLYRGRWDKKIKN